MICPKCGKPSEVGIFCRDCYIEKNIRFRLPKKIELPYCTTCQKYLFKGQWTAFPSPDQAVKSVVKDVLKTNIKKLGGDIKQEIKITGRGKRFEATVTLSKDSLVLEKPTTIEIKRTICPDCGRASSGYYEAVLQVRGEFPENIVEKITRFVSNCEDQRAFISRVEKVRGGLDVYLGSKKVGEKARREFGRKCVEVKKSFKTVSKDRQTSKETRRFYYLLRF